MMDTALEVAGLVAGYGRIGVLRGVSFEVESGSCLGILGHNGMGKTTLLKTIMGLLPAQSGSIRFNGRSVERLPTHARARLGLGYVPQGREIFPALTVRENLLFALAGRSPAGRLEQHQAAGYRNVDDAIGDFPELERLLDRPGGVLSGGEQQLLALARALCGGPALILLDEPTEGIQPSIVQAMMRRVSDLRHRRGVTVLLVEQNLDFIQGLADRVLLIHRGRITREMGRRELSDPALVGEFVGTS
jgi:urea ABC transporter ATP-binding protein UrtE